MEHERERQDGKMRESDNIYPIKGVIISIQSKEKRTIISIQYKTTTTKDDSVTTRYVRHI